MAAADYRIMTDATGQRIATALEAQSIDKAAKTDLTSIIATGTTNATGATIAKGTFFYLNGTLVQAKADIASGASFTSGTNYEAVTAGGLNSIFLNHIVDIEKLTKGRGLTNVNIDDMKTTGISWVQGPQSTGDRPYSYFAFLVLETNHSGIVVQLAIDLSGGSKSRVYANDHWSSWA